jgi:hypothetical protein
MELIIERVEPERDCKYIQDMQECGTFIMRESGNTDYSSAVVLLRNLGERRDTTSLEREALACAIRILRNNMEGKKT